MGIGERPCAEDLELKMFVTPGPGAFGTPRIKTGSGRSTRRGPGMGVGVRGHQTTYNFNSVVLNKLELDNIGPGTYKTDLKWNRPIYDLSFEQSKRPVMTTKKGRLFHKGVT